MSSLPPSPISSPDPPQTPTSAPPNPAQRIDYLSPRGVPSHVSPSYSPPSTSLSALWTPLLSPPPRTSSPVHSLRTTRRQKPPQPAHEPSACRKRNSWPAPPARRPDTTRRKSSDDSCSSSSSSSRSPIRITKAIKRPNTWPVHGSAYEAEEKARSVDMTAQETVEMVYRYIQRPGEVRDEDMADMWDVLRARVQEATERERQAGYEEYVVVEQEDWI